MLRQMVNIHQKTERHACDTRYLGYEKREKKSDKKNITLRSHRSLKSIYAIDNAI